MNNSATVGSYLAQQLRAINANQPRVGDTRNQGRFIAIEWVESRETKKPNRDGAAKIVNALKDRGFLSGNAGAFGNVLKLRPPLVFAMEHANAFLDAYADVIHA